MPESLIPPTAEMIERADRRTRQHIARVAANLMLLAKVTDHGDELALRGKFHDASKFGAEERIPYVWLAEFHFHRRNGEQFEYPPGIEQQVNRAITSQQTGTIINSTQIQMK